MRIVCLQHVPFEGPAAIADRAVAAGHEILGCHLYRGDPLPARDAFDMLVVMGGPMSVNDVARHPWIEPETRLIADVIAAGTPLLGVCLGAQLMAKALGASVYPATEKEIGWFPVRAIDEGAGDILFALPQSFTPLHWHGETFDHPPRAVRLAETEVCANQAFQVGPRAVGLQFHMEATRESVDALVRHCSADITGGRYQQSPEAIREGATRVADLHAILFRLLDFLVR